MKNRAGKSSSAGKGDKPRPCDYKIYSENYDSIAWSPLCCNCGATMSKEHFEKNRDKYIVHEDKSIECKNCNFN